jgi:hypothetical protein
MHPLEDLILVCAHTHRSATPYAGELRVVSGHGLMMPVQPDRDILNSAKSGERAATGVTGFVADSDVA